MYVDNNYFIYLIDYFFFKLTIFIVFINSLILSENFFGGLT